MLRILMFVFGLNLALASVACASDIAVIAGRVPASITPAAKTGAVYLTISNRGDGDDAIVAIASDAADMVHLHETNIVDGVAEMRMFDRLVLPAKSELRMEQGGLHIMLMGLKAPLKVGDRVKLTLTLEKGGALAVDVPVTPLP